jgi:hypothetical protein
MTRQIPSPDVFARTIPLLIERHYFGEHKQASMSTVQTETDKALLALTKRLVRMPETAAIRQHDAKYRQYLKDNAIPLRASWWLVPIGMFDRVRDRSRDWERVRQEELVPRAALAYPAQVDLMRGPLGPNFNPMDYPPVERFMACFWVQWRFIDIGVPNVLREIRAEAFEEERAKVRAEADRAKTMIEQHLAGSLLKITDHLADLLRPKANGRKPGLRDGALNNLLEFLDTIALRDVTDFRDLQAVTARLRATAQGLTVEALRDDEVRARTADAIEAAREAVNGLVTDETRRAIRFRDDEEDAA